MSIEIRLWHGILPKPLMARLDSIAVRIESDTELPVWKYSNSLDEFANEWGGKFIAYPVTDVSSDANFQIYVTGFNSWSQR